MLEIDFNKLDAKIDGYVSEFYTDPKPLIDRTNKYVQLFRDSLKDRIHRKSDLHELQSLNAKMIRPDSSGEGRSCLKAPIKLQKVIGQGAYGKVYKINSNTVAKVCSVKDMYVEKKNEKRERIQMEFELSRLAAKIGVGPKVFDNYACCSKDGECFYVLYMENVKGIILRDWLEKSKPEAKQKVKDMLKTKIGILHKNHIIHHDLHPGNVFVVGSQMKPEDVVIIDYGMAESSKTAAKNMAAWDMRVLDWAFDNNGQEVQDEDVASYVVVRMLDNGEIKITE